MLFAHIFKTTKSTLFKSYISNIFNALGGNDIVTSFFLPVHKKETDAAKLALQYIEMVLFYYILQVGVVLSIASLSFFLYQKLSACYTNHKTLKLEMANLRVQVTRTTPEKDEKLKTLYKNNPTALEIIENATKDRNVRLYSVNSIQTSKTPVQQDSVIQLNITHKQYKKVENDAKILPLN